MTSIINDDINSKIYEIHCDDLTNKYEYNC